MDVLFVFSGFYSLILFVCNADIWEISSTVAAYVTIDKSVCAKCLKCAKQKCHRHFLLSLTNTESVTFTLVRQIKGMARSLSKRGQMNCVEVNRNSTESYKWWLSCRNTQCSDFLKAVLAVEASFYNYVLLCWNNAISQTFYDLQYEKLEIEIGVKVFV